jgi:hypothetical protein
MMMHDEKKALMTIMRSRKDSKDPGMAAPMKTESVSNEDGEPDGRHAAAQDMMAAMNEKSPEKLMAAMMNFHDLHAMDRLKSYDKAEIDQDAEGK